MKKGIIILFAATLGLAACNNYKKGPGGLMYKIHKDGGNEKIKEGDVIKVNFIQKNERDSVMFNTYDVGQGQIFPVGKMAYAGDMNDVLFLFGEGDSATFKLNLDTMAKNTGQPKPPANAKDTYLVFTVKIEKVFKKGANEADSTFQKRAGEFFQADYKATMDKMKGAEDAKLKAYEADKNLKTTVSPSGLHYVIVAPGDSQRAAVGDTVSVNYTGSTTKLNKDKKYKVFDTSDEKIAKANNAFQNGRPYGPTKMVLGSVIPGFNEGLQLIGKGGKITMIIPSKLGYGDQGNPQAGITPFTPIAFDVEIVEIIKGKPVTAAPPVPVPAH